MRPGANAEIAALFDGWCGVCTRSSAWVGARDIGNRVERLDLREAGAAERFPGVDASAAREQLHVVDRSGHVFVGIEALARLLTEIPRWTWIGRAIALPGVQTIAGIAYRYFASRRLWFNRWFPLADKTCDGNCTHAPSEPSPAAPKVASYKDGRRFLQ